MSEADTPNNQPLPEPTASIDDSVAELADETGTVENPQVVNLTDELPTFKDFVQQSRQEQTNEIVRITPALSTSPQTDDSGTQTPEACEPERTKDADWFALAQKMRQRNRRLLEQVAQLRQALKENQEALLTEQMRSHERDLFLAQQTDEFKTLQEQLARLFQTLESSHQAAQRQQILIETLSEQLQSSQERVAQLERECALTQQRYNEQSHQLLQSANTCRELKTRLHRQQRQTLQFKAALEKSLEMSSSSNAVPKPQPPYKNSNANQSLIHKGQPIQPWSAEPVLEEDTSNLDTIWNEPVRLDPLLRGYSSQPEPFKVKPIEETALPSTADISGSAEAAIEKISNLTPITPDSVEASPFAQEAQNARQDLVGSFGTQATQPLSIVPFTASQDSVDIELELEQQLLAEMTSLAEASGLSEFQSDVSDTSAPLTPQLETHVDESDTSVVFMSDIQQTQAPGDLSEWDDDVDRPNEELWETSTNRELAQLNEVVLPQSNWPSPVLYPLRPPKKRKSLAAIELPSFPRQRPG
ncbi:MAG TPA: hypothetical protein DCP31_32180 [Cyanobacteria bacterium UBA8543]|nr:hypothetical protein [Cyanobacteria bacterium UBA8543]